MTNGDSPIARAARRPRALTGSDPRSIIFSMDDHAPAFTRPRAAYWACQLAGWGIYTATKLYGAVAMFQLPLVSTARDLIALSGLGLGCTHLVRRYFQRHAWGSLPLPSLIARMVAVSVAFALPLGALSLLSPISSLQNPDTLDRYTATGTVTGGDPELTFAVQAGNWAFVLMTWQTLYFASLTLRARRWALLHQSELTRALQLAELRALKSQLNPHFLFNALNTVRSLIAEDPKRAQEAVTRLASTLPGR